LKSRGWITTIDDKPVPTYLTKELIMDGSLAISNGAYSEIKKRTEPTYLTYHNVGEFIFDANSFELETSIRNTYSSGPAVCQISKLILLCTKGAIIIPLSVPGCVSDLNVMVGDNYLSGKENDLRVFTTDMTGWQNLKLEAQNNNLSIFLNELKIYDVENMGDLGKLVGIRFSFLGAGEVDYLRINSWDRKISYSEEFETEI